MLQGPVAVTCVRHSEATCSVVGTKSQHVHTHENVTGTCFKDMLQRHVPSCELILL